MSFEVLSGIQQKVFQCKGILFPAEVLALRAGAEAASPIFTDDKLTKPLAALQAALPNAPVFASIRDRFNTADARTAFSTIASLRLGMIDELQRSSFSVAADVLTRFDSSHGPNDEGAAALVSLGAGLLAGKLDRPSLAISVPEVTHGREGVSMELSWIAWSRLQEEVQGHWKNGVVEGTAANLILRGHMNVQELLVGDEASMAVTSDSDFFIPLSLKRTDEKTLLLQVPVKMKKDAAPAVERWRGAAFLEGIRVLLGEYPWATTAFEHPQEIPSFGSSLADATLSFELDRFVIRRAGVSLFFDLDLVPVLQEQGLFRTTQAVSQPSASEEPIRFRRRLGEGDVKTSYERVEQGEPLSGLATSVLDWNVPLIDLATQIAQLSPRRQVLIQRDPQRDDAFRIITGTDQSFSSEVSMGYKVFFPRDREARFALVEGSDVIIDDGSDQFLSGNFTIFSPSGHPAFSSSRDAAFEKRNIVLWRERMEGFPEADDSLSLLVDVWRLIDTLPFTP